MKYLFSLILLFFSFISSLSAEEGRLLRYPNASSTQITFCYGGDIYVAPKDGGLAMKLTSSQGYEMFPRFSPDGLTIAFTAEYDGNREIYTMPNYGGEPYRLTYSMDLQGLPDRMGPDKIIMQWTADGNKILYRARNEVWNAWTGKLYLVDKKGTLPEELPLPRGGFSSFSPDMKKIAYNRVFREFRTWKRYRGGQADDIWIYNFETKKIENITNNSAQDIIPMWYKDKIYFLSDRDHYMNIFMYDLNTKQITKITNFDKYDVKFPSLGPDNIAFENGGYIYLLDLTTNKYQKVNIQINGDFPNARTKITNVKDNIAKIDISPDGKRALFAARGEIFTVPAEKGLTKRITNTTAVHNRYPVWSPDGKWIAYISDESGDDEIYLIKPDGSNKIQLTKNTDSYKFGLLWSPDSKKILYSDKLMKLYYIDIETKNITEVRKSKVWEITDASWSPDSKWIAFVDYDANPFSVIFIYSLNDNKTVRVTDDFFESNNPCFSEDGKYLFFVSDRTFNASINNIEWNFSYNNMSKIYGITLQDTLKSPFAFVDEETQLSETSEANKETEEKEKPAKSKKKSSQAKEEKEKSINIDFSNIKNRIFELPISVGNYANLFSIKDKLIYFKNSNSKSGIYYFDFEEKKESEVGNYQLYAFTNDGKKILFKSGNDYYITKFKANIKPDEGKLDLSDLNIELNKKAEWKQIFDESWRQMKHFFYAPNMHGVDWKAMYDKYSELVPYVVHRADLTYIIGEMIGELNCGHSYVGGGEQPEVEDVNIGLLGAKLELDKNSGYYRIKTIYKGRNWEENTRSPLTEPGIDIKEGDYIIAIDGVKLTSDVNPYKLLVNKAKKYITLKINSKPSDIGTKDYTIKTISSEGGLVYYNWVEKNREYVEKVSNGKVGYVHIPDMAVNNGLNEFVKYFYPQARKEALIVDDRYNGGGNVSPMIIERLRRILLVAKIARNQEMVLTNPDAVMTGPMVCLINELSASDGDLFPYQFSKAGLGKLIGKRTWGGVIGIRGSLPFLDGGYLMRPEFANYGPEDNGKWVLEGVGMYPDIEVDNDPALEYEGIDQQLQKALEVIQEEMKTNKKTKIPGIPPYPDKSK